MSKTRQKNASEVEHLRGENKKLKSENKKLRRDLNSYRKKAHFYENIVDEVVVDDVEPASNCNNCGKGVMMYFDLVHVKMEICDLCGHKENLNGKS